MDALTEDRIILLQLRREDSPNDLERLERMLNALPPTLLIDLKNVTPEVKLFRLRAYDYPLNGGRVYYVYQKERHANGQTLTGIQRLTDFESFVQAIVGSVVGVSKDPLLLMDVERHIKSKDPALKEAVVRVMKSVVDTLIKEENQKESIDGEWSL